MCLAVRRPRSSSAARAVSMKNQLGAGTLRRGRFLCWFAAARARYAGLLSCQEPPTPNWDRNVCIASLSAFSQPGVKLLCPLIAAALTGTPHSRSRADVHRLEQFAAPTFPTYPLRRGGGCAPPPALAC